MLVSHLMNSTKDCLDALKEGHIDMAVNIVKNVESEAELNDVMRLEGSPHISLLQFEYLLGFVNWRLQKLSDAKRNFIAAANGGMFSGYYCAAQISEELSESSIESQELLRKAASEGHLWSMLILTREKAKNGSVSSKCRNYLYRFVLAPIQIVICFKSDARRERLRY